MALKPFAVSQINNYIKRILQSDPILGNVSVKGEISNLKYHGSGHVYFTLKDESSKLNCFLSFENAQNLRYVLDNGMEIIASGYIYLYEKGGSYSLNVGNIEIEGLGNLHKAFEKLKQKLNDEGLFDEAYKKSIPFFPKTVAVITSETGAAVRDIIKTIRHRNQYVNIILFPCLVQGDGAAADISEQINNVNRYCPEADVIILGRGGGSTEELWPFNEEIVARSIFDSPIPVISAVGHETDFTISDFVADIRAATPTAAAAMAVPDIAEIWNTLEKMHQELTKSINLTVSVYEMKLAYHNFDNIYSMMSHFMSTYEAKIDQLLNDISSAIKEKLLIFETGIDNQKITLDNLNPRNIMRRGYAAIVNSQGDFIKTVNQLTEKEDINLYLNDGRVDCKVMNIDQKGESL